MSESNFLKKSAKIFLIIFVVFIISLFIFDSFIMPSYVKNYDVVKVPNVVNLKSEEANQKLKDFKFNPVQSEIRIDRTHPAGIVVAQNPLPNKEVKSGRNVYLIISGGEEFISAPNLIGKTFREAKANLIRNGLQIGEILHDTSIIYPKGTIKFQNIDPKSKIKRDDKINIVLSVGEELINEITPNLIGKNLNEAEQIIINSGFIVGNITFVPKENQRNKVVLEQNPNVGEQIKLNQKIDLIISEKKVTNSKRLN